MRYTQCHKVADEDFNRMITPCATIIKAPVIIASRVFLCNFMDFIMHISTQKSRRNNQCLSY